MTERSTEDRAFDRGMSTLRRTERSTEDGGALINKVLSTEDVALDAGRKCQLSTALLTEGRALDAGLET